MFLYLYSDNFLYLCDEYVCLIPLRSSGLLTKRIFQITPHNTLLLNNDTSFISVNIFNKKIILLTYVNIFTWICTSFKVHAIQFEKDDAPFNEAFKKGNGWLIFILFSLFIQK